MELKYNPTLEQLPSDINIPKHVAFNPNGNRRWAENKHLPTYEGHKTGAEAVVSLIEAGHFYGIHTMTFWGFSTENWTRNNDEIDALMEIFEEFYDNHIDEIIDKDTRIVHLGRKDRLPESLVNKISQSEETTKENTSHTLNIAVDYGGHDEIMRAVEKVVQDVQDGKIEIKKIFEKDGWYIENKMPYHYFKNYLDTKDQPYPYPDIVIRSAGDKRTSGFLPWQSAYSEYIWFDEYFPEFNGQHLYDAIMAYNQRERRFGGNPSSV